jgi:Putative metallopeptidase
MTRTTKTLLLGLALLCLPAAAQHAPAQQLQNPNIEIAYVEPANADYRPIYERLKARKVLEELRAFLAPLKLPKKIMVNIDQCNAPDRMYQPDGPVTVCYEYIAQLEQLAAKIPADGKTQRGVTRDDAIVGAFVQVVLQRMASAVFDQLGVPIWGREQDAADKLAGFLMLQFGTDTARKLLNGAAYFFEASDRTWSGSDFSDVRGTESQRFYNYLCVAYGGDKRAFSDFVQTNTLKNSKQRVDLLPEERATQCAHEYDVLKWGFDTMIMPSIDRDLLQKVLARKWLRPNDGSSNSAN